MKTYDLVIVGGGVCGMTAAIYAARANLSTCILEKDVCGGLVKTFLRTKAYTVWNSWLSAAIRSKLSA